MMHSGKNFTGNSRFYGFCIDILERVSREVGFDYLIDLVPDRKYGACDPETGRWNGMVLELIQHVCILCIFLVVAFICPYLAIIMVDCLIFFVQLSNLCNEFDRC